MYERILFPTDGSQGAAVAFNHVLDIAAEHDSTVHVLNVVELTTAFQGRGNVIDTLERDGERIVRDAADRAQQAG